MSLIKEINDLRRELKLARTAVHDLEAALGLHRKSNKESASQMLLQVTYYVTIIPKNLYKLLLFFLKN